MDGAQVTLIVGAIGSVLAFFGTIANMVYTSYKENRARAWAKEDKEELAKHNEEVLRRATEETLAHHKATQDKLDEIQKKAQERLDTIMRGQCAIASKVDENTAISVTAFAEANGVNAKIVALGQQLVNEPKNVVVVNKEPIDVHPK